MSETPSSRDIDRMIRTIEREIRLRQRVYPRLVARGRITAEECAQEIEAMTDVLAYLRGQRLIQLSGGPR